MNTKRKERITVKCDRLNTSIEIDRERDKAWETILHRKRKMERQTYRKRKSEWERERERERKEREIESKKKKGERKK